MMSKIAQYDLVSAHFFTQGVLCKLKNTQLRFFKIEPGRIRTIAYTGP